MKKRQTALQNGGEATENLGAKRGGQDGWSGPVECVVIKRMGK